MTPLAESHADFQATLHFDPDVASRLDSSAQSSHDTTGLPASAGVRLVRSSARSDGPLQEGQKFGPRYHILNLLGVGGMGAVYQAWDAELSVAVALKVIRPEVSQDPAAAHEIERRFKQELLLARQVTHKNVVRIYDLGEIDGIKYITMSYIQGKDLATTLRERVSLPISEVMPLARQIVAGLAAAHEAGVVHRDLKPGNIMIEAGHAIVMDFGIARSTSQTSVGPTLASGPLPTSGMATWDNAVTQAAPTIARGTIAGAVVGTIEYMAPEQARGEPVDQRADIYAFGLILYDLLLGRRRAEHSPSAIAELETRMEHTPQAPRSIVEEMPEALNQLVLRCLEPDPAKRFQTTNELAAALDRLDDSGKPLPIHRVVGMRVAVAALGLFMALLVGTWWFARGPAVPVQHDPVSVLIADFQNGTNDPTFDRTLEPMLKLALEGASFISAYDRSGITRSLGVRPPEKLDERAALELAVRQGLGVVLSGSLDREGSGYTVSVKATQAVTGNVITSAKSRAASKDQVVGVATQLTGTVREALGDETSEADRRFATQTFSATSLEVVREYALGAEALSQSKFEDARQSFSKSVALDPNFGLGYAGVAVASRNLRRQEDAEKFIKEAIRHLDSMTERERYRTRGLFYYITNDYQACVKEYGDLIARYAADAPARNNLALCLTFLRELPRALNEMQQVIKILPKRVLYRENLALYAAYSGDSRTGEAEARAMEKPTPLGLLALAFAQLLQGQLPEATETYEQMGMMDKQAASRMAAGLGDLALYEGRFSHAARIFAEGADADLASKESDRAAAKFVALGYTQLLRQQKDAAIASAEKALLNSKVVKIRFLAARVFVEAGSIARAQTLAKSLASELQVEPQVYAKIIDAEVALKNGDARQAIRVLTEANTLLDTWIGHFDLGRAYLEAGGLTQADSEFDRCIARRGEVLALFLDEEPTYGYMPPVYYYQGRVREGLNTARFAESYRTYLKIRGQSNEDPLLPDVRRRAGG